MNIVDSCEYLWPYFFPIDKFNKQDAKILPIQLFATAFENSVSKEILQSALESKVASFPLHMLRDHMNFRDFEISLTNRPCEVLGSLGIALSIAVHKHTMRSQHQLPSNTTSSSSSVISQSRMITPISVRITNLDPQLKFSDIKSSKVGQLVSISGYVVKASSIRPLVQHAKFLCNKCMSLHSYYLEDGIFNPPSTCATTQCRNKYLELQRNGVSTIPYQRIKIQEPDDSSDDSARVPRTFDIEARGDLVNSCRVGDIITVVGIVKTSQIDIQRVTKGVIKDGGLHQLYLLINSLSNHQHQSQRQVDGHDTNASSSQASSSIAIYQSIANHSLCLAHLCASLCPTIYGHDLVKSGLLLALVGGTTTSSSGDSNYNTGVHLRSDIHVLMVGDPGLGKSQLLRSCVSIASRGIIVCGNTSSAAGLTVTVGRDGRDTSIEAGALVLADQGICCIDELDKLACDYHALLEAMEQQRISVAKGGVVTSLKSRASIIAAANPASGHYQRKKSLCENLKMPSSLISRFDIVFLLLDRPDEAHDRRLSEHIMNSRNLSSSSSSHHEWNHHHPIPSSGIISDADDHRTFSQRLRYQCQHISSSQIIPFHIIREYIEHARKYVHPRLTSEAAKILQKLYLTLRAQSSIGKTIPVTTRHLESLIRLSQARAKIELRSEVTASDANDVVDLLQESLLDAFTDEVGEVDFGRKGGMGLAKQIKAIVKTLSREAEIKESKIFTMNELKDITQRMKVDRDLDSIIDILRTECYLLYKGPRLYQLQT